MFNTNKFIKAVALSTLSATFILGASQSWAAGAHGGGHGSKSSIGNPEKAAAATRTIKINMLDNYYEPKEFTVKEGETIRFIVKNAGELVHEFNIGTAVMHSAHQKEMEMMVDHGALEADKINPKKMKMDMGSGKVMKHSDPNSVLLEPGKSGEVIWKFSKASKLEFACNVPGHYEAGMMGPIRFVTKQDSSS
ncbi:MAG: cupredoxin family protein [Rhodospirillales bacterium]|nr:cupredoxin family protein [Rhodospirillales bacterium]